MNKRYSRVLQLLLGLLLSLLVALASVGLLTVAGWLIGAAALAGLHPATAPYFNYFIPAAGIRFFAIVRIASRYGERVITHDVTFYLLSNLRVFFYQKMEALVPAYFMRYRLSDLLNRSVADIDTLDQVYLRILIPFVVAILLSFLMLCFFHYFSWTIACLVCLSMLTIIVVSTLLCWSGNKLSKTLQRITAQYRIDIIDFLSGMKELLLFSAHKIQHHKILQTQERFRQLQSKLNQLEGLSTAMVIAVSGFIVWLILYIGIPMVHDRVMSAPIFCMIVLGVLAAFEVLMPLPRAFINIGAVSIAALRLNDIVHEKPTVVFYNRDTHHIFSYDIELKNINFSYHSDYPVFQNFNLTIVSKEKLVIEGPSGVGKSSLLHLLARFYDPCAGVISIADIPMTHFSESQLRDTITLVSQQDYFFNDSIKENLRIAAPAASDAKLWTVLKKVHLDHVVKQRPYALDTPMGEGGQCFSMGQLRRFSIARGLLRATPIMLFDEPTEGLDADTASMIWRLLLRTLVDKTVIVVTHRLPISQYEYWHKLAIFEQRP